MPGLFCAPGGIWSLVHAEGELYSPRHSHTQGRESPLLTVSWDVAGLVGTGFCLFTTSDYSSFSPVCSLGFRLLFSHVFLSGYYVYRIMGIVRTFPHMYDVFRS